MLFELGEETKTAVKSKYNCACISHAVDDGKRNKHINVRCYVSNEACENVKVVLKQCSATEIMRLKPAETLRPNKLETIKGLMLIANSALGTVMQRMQKSKNRGRDNSVEVGCSLANKVCNTQLLLLNVSCGALPRGSSAGPPTVHEM